MPTPSPYMLFPYGVNSDSVNVPDQTGSSTGTLSYEYGYTVNYEQDLLTTSTALPIPRDLTNGLFYDITYAIQQYQNHGAPNWVASGSGGPTNYPLYSRVLYSDGNVYESQIASNTSVPGADANWNVISGSGLILNSVVTSGVSVGSNGALINITSLLIPAGTWLLSGNVTAIIATATNVSIAIGINSTTATLPSSWFQSAWDSVATSFSGNRGGPCPNIIVTLESPTTYYLVLQGFFGGGGTMTGLGQMSAVSINSAT